MNGQISFFDLTPDKEEQPKICLAEVPESEFLQAYPVPIPTLNEIIKTIDGFNLRFSSNDVIRDVFEFGALTISNSVDQRKSVYERREKVLGELKTKYGSNFENLADIFAKIWHLLLSQMYSNGRMNDWLGELYMRSLTQSKGAGQFFTPYDVSRACALLAVDPEKIAEAKEKDLIVDVHEPTVGAGGMVTALVDELYNKYHFNVARNLYVDCGDIDKRCVYMTYIQLSLLGIPAVVFHRDGLSLKTWDCFHTPALCMQWLRFRPLVRESYDYLKGKEIDF